MDHRNDANHEPYTPNEAYTVGSGNNNSQFNIVSTSKKRWRKDDESIEKVMSEMNDLGTLLARSIIKPVIDAMHEKLLFLNGALCSLERINKEELWKAHVMFSKNRDFVLILFGVEPIDHLE